ncbi:MAG: nucleotidyltransferase domain-containing protein [Pseudomonadota bacterium]
MDKTKTKLNKLLKTFLEIVDKCFFIESIYVFGSYANNKQKTYSDIDLALVSRDFQFTDTETIMIILARIARSTNSKIEPVVFSNEEIKKPVLGTLAWEVANKGLKLR